MLASIWILIGTVLYCVLCLLMIPIIVMLFKKDIAPQGSDDFGEQHRLQLENTFRNARANPPNRLCHYISRNCLVCMDAILDIAEPDEEVFELNKLIFPLVTSSIVTNLFDVVAVGLVGNFVGTDAVVAFSVTSALLSITDSFIKGLPDAENTICSHAIGKNDNFLAGQYVQITISIYVAYSIPTMLIWYFFIDDILVWMGLSSVIVELSIRYVTIAIFHLLMEGIGEAFMALLDVSNHAMFGTFVDIIEGLLSTTIVAIVVMTNDETSLTTLALIYLCSSVISIVSAFTIALSRGWLDPFLDGMFKNIAIKNSYATKNLLYNALPLGLGSLCTYGEWEILTLFVTRLGPAPVAAWAILSSIWDLFESSSEGCGEAAAIRVAFHLGNGNPRMAKVSANKSILLVVIIASMSTSIFFICSENIPSLFTKDTAIQHEIMKALPLMGVGNLTMATGVIAWYLIGAQNRFAFATTLTIIITFVITLPLASLFVYVIGWELDSVVASVVFGYSTVTSVLCSILFTSDWAYHSSIIINEGEDHSNSSNMNNRIELISTGSSVSSCLEV